MKRLLLLLFLTSCVKTEVINEAVPQIDTVRMYKPHRPPHPPVPPSDTTEVNDTTRVPIGFDPSVGDWDEEDIDL